MYSLPELDSASSRRKQTLPNIPPMIDAINPTRRVKILNRIHSSKPIMSRTDLDGRKFVSLSSTKCDDVPGDVGLLVSVGCRNQLEWVGAAREPFVGAMPSGSTGRGFCSGQNTYFMNGANACLPTWPLSCANAVKSWLYSLLSFPVAELPMCLFPFISVWQKRHFRESRKLIERQQGFAGGFLSHPPASPSCLVLRHGSVADWSGRMTARQDEHQTAQLMQLAAG